MDGISCSSVAGGFLTIVFEVNVIDLVVQDMPCGDKKFSGDGHNDFHHVFLSYLCLMIGEPAEEAVPGPAGRPCAFDDGFPQEGISVGYASGLHFLVRLVVSRLQPAPGSQVVGGRELAHVRSDLSDQ